MLSAKAGRDAAISHQQYEPQICCQNGNKIDLYGVKLPRSAGRARGAIHGCAAKIFSAKRRAAILRNGPRRFRPLAWRARSLTGRVLPIGREGKPHRSHDDRSGRPARPPVIPRSAPLCRFQLKAAAFSDLKAAAIPI
jgi:hypothetical protein